MKIFMVWGQRICKYPGEYAPELLEAMSEYADEDNPDIINNAFKTYSESGEFSCVRIIEANIRDMDLEKALGKVEVKLSGVVVV